MESNYSTSTSTSAPVPPLISFDYMKSQQLSPSRDFDTCTNTYITDHHDGGVTATTTATTTNTTSTTASNTTLTPNMTTPHPHPPIASSNVITTNITTNRKFSKHMEKKSTHNEHHDNHNEFHDHDDKKKINTHIINTSSLSSLYTTYCLPIIKLLQNKTIQKVLSIPLSLLFFILIKKIFAHHQSLEYFFTWMEQHPNKGMVAYLIIYPLHMLLFLPGTPMVMGAGYIFKIRFGWLWGVSLCSIITLFGSLIGSIMCFLLGRYCMRSSVRKWSKKYPLFEPIDAAVSVNSFKIMSLLYLTPVIPLGPLSYVMGTTSMPLISFAKAKIAALPLTVLYVYLGAAAGTLVAESEEDQIDGGNGSTSNVTSKGMKELKVDPKLIFVGIICSIGSIALISIKMKKELQKILDEQNKDKEIGSLISNSNKNNGIKMNISSGQKTRQRLYSKKSGLEEIELQDSSVV